MAGGRLPVPLFRAALAAARCERLQPRDLTILLIAWLQEAALEASERDRSTSVGAEAAAADARAAEVGPPPAGLVGRRRPWVPVGPMTHAWAPEHRAKGHQ